MTKPMTKIVEADGTEILREMTEEEYAQYQIDMAEVAAKETERLAKEALRQSRREKLLALGLTEEELDA